MSYPLYLVDTFTQSPFQGNPAAVCPLERWLDDATLQHMAAEHNQAETAFFVPRQGGGFDLRWFTPAIEVDLCGHATLAAAYVLYETQSLTEAVFYIQNDVLTVRRADDLYFLDFPARPAKSALMNEALAGALGARPAEVYSSERDVLALYECERDIVGLKPDMQALYNLIGQPRLTGYIATAPGEECDFVSRFFCPNGGIPEDPVTGSAHSVLIPFWSERLGLTEMRARQLSRRGGRLFCRHRGTRVDIGGGARLYAKGEIML